MGTQWVIESHDAFLFGNRFPSPTEDDEIPCEDGPLRQILVEDLPELRIDKWTVKLLDPAVSPDVHGCRSPREAFDSNATWRLRLQCRMCINGEITSKRLFVSHLPLMIGSMLYRGGIGETDPGGYFVIEGKEKIVVNRERRRTNVPRFFKDSKGFGVRVDSFRSPLEMRLTSSTKEIKVWMPMCSGKNTFPLSNFLNVLRVNRRELLEASEEPEVVDTLMSNFLNVGEEEDEEWLMKLGEHFNYGIVGTSDSSKRSRVLEVVKDSLFPFLHDDLEEKKRMIVSCAVGLVERALGRRSLTDTEALENKRVDTVYFYLTEIFRHSLFMQWRSFENNLRKAVVDFKKSGNGTKKKRPIDLISVFVSTDKTVETTMCRVLKTGQASFLGRTGITVPVPRRTAWTEMQSVIRSVDTQHNRQSRDLNPRMIHGSTYGFYDVVETQENSGIGLVKHLAVFARITVEGDVREWKKRLSSSSSLSGSTAAVDVKRIYLNGKFVCSSSTITLEDVKEMKKKFDPYASVFSVNSNEIHVDVSDGRPIKPIKNLSTGEKEWIDAREQSSMQIAASLDTRREWHTHVEWEPYSLMGSSSACVPFAQSNAATRNLFAAHVMHQAIGVPTSVNFPFKKITIETKEGERKSSRIYGSSHDRFDSDSKHFLWYPQRALCDTKHAFERGNADYPCGVNATIAILAAINAEEDSIQISKSFLDRGGYRTVTEKSVEDVLRESDTHFGLPEEKKRVFPSYRYRHLDERDGTAKQGSQIHEGDVLISKVRTSTGEDLTDCVWDKRGVVATVDEVMTCDAWDGSVRRVVRLRWTRRPEVGDKFASRHGQKGVIGMEVSQENLPFTMRDGVTPDVVLNCHAFPSRMCIGHLLETLVGKVICLDPPNEGYRKNGTCNGTCLDCTPFSPDFDLEKTRKLLKEKGYQCNGREKMISGTTGLPMDALILIGPVFYQRLAHFADDKCYARSEGAVNPLTKQPLRGMRVNGGMRMGEMELSALVSHGASQFQKDRFLTCSDGVEVTLCMNEKCGGDVSSFNSEGLCVACGSSRFETVTVPYAYVLLKNQLRSCMFDLKFRLKQK